MKYLYHIAWEFEDVNREPDWTHFVSDKDYIATDEEREIIEHFMRDNFEEEPSDYNIVNSWCEKIERIDGYKIRLVKE